MNSLLLVFPGKVWDSRWMLGLLRISALPMVAVLLKSNTTDCLSHTASLMAAHRSH